MVKSARAAPFLQANDNNHFSADRRLTFVNSGESRWSPFILRFLGTEAEKKCRQASAGQEEKQQQDADLDRSVQSNSPPGC